MTVPKRLLAAFLCSVFFLVACSPSSDKPAEKKPLVVQASSQGELAPDQYDVLPVALPAEAGDKVEVIEFFAYYCSHCRAMDPSLAQWAKQNADRVVFKRVPVAFREDAVLQQRMYYALIAMDKLEALHPKAFAAVQDEGNSLDSHQKIFDFVARHNIDLVKFKEAYDSFGIQSQVLNAQELQSAYQIQAVPVVAVDGRFMTSASHASKRPGVETVEEAYAATMTVMSELVEKVRKERANTASGSTKQ